MKKIIKKTVFFIAILLIFLILNSKQSVVAATEYTDNVFGFKYTIGSDDSGNYAIITGTTDDFIADGVEGVWLNDEIGGYPVKEIAEYAFSGNTSILVASLPSTLETIGKGAFSGCSNLFEVTLRGNNLTLHPKVFEGTAIECLEFKRGTNYLTGTECKLYSGALEGMNNLKSIYFEGRNFFKIVVNETGIDSLSQSSINYLKNNATIYGCSSLPGTDDATDNAILSPKGFANCYGIKFDELITTPLSITDTTIGIVIITTCIPGSPTVSMTVSPLDETSEEYKDMTEELDDLDDYEIVLSCDVSITNAVYFDPLTATFPVDEKYNGKTAIILHKKKDGTIEKLTSTVENGQIKITVTELSPFIVAFNADATSPSDPSPTDPSPTNPSPSAPPSSNSSPQPEATITPGATDKLDDSPKTGTIDFKPVILALILICSVGIVFIIKKD